MASAADLQAPSRPTGLTTTGVTTTSISVKWKASSDNVGVTGYRVYRNGMLVGTTGSRSYSLSSLSCGTSYTVTVTARDASRNQSPPATSSPTTAACAPKAPPCPTPESVFGLLLEHKIEYGCGRPHGWAARQAVGSIRTMLAGRKAQLTTWRAEKWHRVVLDELDAAAAADAAWTGHGVLAANAAGFKVQYRIGRAIRLLHSANDQLYTVSRAENRALAALSWYIAASEYDSRAGAGADPAVLTDAGADLKRADSDFFSSSVYPAWGHYRSAWQTVTGLG